MIPQLQSLSEYMDIICDLLPYSFTPIDKYNGKNLYAIPIQDLPLFTEFVTNKKRWVERNYQKTIKVNSKNVLFDNCMGGVSNPIGGDWLYHYRYSLFRGYRYNVSERIYNPQFKINEQYFKSN